VVTGSAGPTANPEEERLKGMINGALVSLSTCTTYKSDGKNVAAALSCDAKPALAKKILLLSQGREACYHKDGTFWIFWSYTDERVVARVGDSGSKTAAGWFADHRAELLA